MTLTNSKLYPGMNDSGLEFFTVESEVKIIQNGKISAFTELSFAIIQVLKEAISKDKELKMALLDWHPNSEYNRLEQFAKCRFGGLDFTPDIKNNKLQKGEYKECPLRATCPNNGIVCKLPSFNGIELELNDIKLMKLLSTDLTNENIAEQMGVPFGSYHKIKKALYQKLGNVQTKQEIAIIATRLNLI